MSKPSANDAVYQPKTIFGRLAQFVLDRRLAASLGILAVILLAVFLVWTRLGLDSNLLSLLPKDEPLVESIHEFQDQGAKLEQMNLSVTGDDEAVDAFFDDLHAGLSERRIDGKPIIEHTFYKLDEDLAKRLGAVQASKRELENMRDKIKASLALGKAQSAITSSILFGSSTPSQNSDLGTSKLKGAEHTQSLFRRGGARTMMIRPSVPSEDVGFNIAFMKIFEHELDSLVRSKNNLEGHDVEVIWTGGAYRHSYEDYEGVRADMRWTGLLACALIFILLSLAFRSKRVVFLVFLPLVIGTLLTFGFAAMTVQDLNMFTSFFGAILIGLGVDFSIHLYTRYREERAVASSLKEAVIRAWDCTGPPCMVAALTSAGGFLALMVGDFTGFSELGLLLGVGVLVCLMSVLIILPLLIGWWEKNPKPYRKRKKNRDRKPPTYRFAPLILMLLVLVTVAFSFALKNLEIEYDISALRRDGEGYEELSEQQQELVRNSFAPVLIGYDTPEELLEAHQKYEKLVEEKRFNGIGGVFSIYSLLPSDQEERLGVLEEIRDLSSHEDYPRLNQEVRTRLAPLQDLTLEPLTRADLPQGLLELTASSADPDSKMNNLVLLAEENMWDLKESRILLDELERELGDQSFTGRHLINGVLYSLVRRDAPLVCLVALLMVCLATLLDLKKPLQAMGAVGVLMAGMLWAGAAVSLFQIKLSIVNIVGIAILLGIGVDVVIHLLHRIREEGPGGIHKALETTGWAAALSATTTVMSFASLSLAGGRGIRGLGQLVLVGLTAITIAAFLLLPTGWMTAWKLGGDMPDEDTTDTTV